MPPYRGQHIRYPGVYPVIPPWATQWNDDGYITTTGPTLVSREPQGIPRLCYILATKHYRISLGEQHDA